MRASFQESTVFDVDGDLNRCNVKCRLPPATGFTHSVTRSSVNYRSSYTRGQSVTPSFLLCCKLQLTSFMCRGSVCSPVGRSNCPGRPYTRGERPSNSAGRSLIDNAALARTQSRVVAAVAMVTVVARRRRRRTCNSNY